MSPWYVLGRIGEERLPDIWRGARAAELRSRLEVGDLSAGCDACRGPIEAGERDRSFAVTFDDLPLADTDHDPAWPAQLELALSNTCNLRCVMCNGTLSSAIRSGREGLPPLPTVYDDAFFDDLVPFLDHVQRISFLGGEPFLARETWRVVDLLRTRDLHPLLQVTTNGTIWTGRIEHFLTSFRTDVVVSVDAVAPETMRAIRVGIDPDAVWRNLDRLRIAAAAGGGSTAIAHCLMVDNWREFHSLLRRADDLGLDVFLNDVTWPTHQSIRSLPVPELHRVLLELEGQEGRRPPLGRNRRIWDQALAGLRHPIAGSEVSVSLDPRPLPRHGRREAAEFVVDHRQTLVGVLPDPADVFGVDLRPTLGRPVGEWMQRFQAVHGHLVRSSVSRSEAGGEHWALEVQGPVGTGHLEAEFTPTGADGGRWRLVLTRP